MVMPKGSKIASFEKQVKGKMPKSEMYAIADKDGLMRGNKVTARGAQKAKRK
jgi:hypothetical protein